MFKLNFSLKNIIIIIILVIVSSAESSLITTKCEYYNHTICQDTGKGCNETEYCEVAEPNKRNHCYVLWQNSSNGELQIKFKVCVVLIGVKP
jgi:activin receptor type-2